MASRLSKIVILAFFLLPKVSYCQVVNTTLIKDLKNFFFKEIGYVLKGDFFTKWDNKDCFYLFVSPSDRIDDANETKKYTETSDNDTIKDHASYDTLYYDVPADAGCKLRPEFTTYSPEGLAFVIFHELMHNFIIQKKLDIPYVFNEAICDIMGNYCTLDFAKSDARIHLHAAQQQIMTNNKLYTAINRCITTIGDHPEMLATAHATCEARINKLLGNANKFQKFRFAYKVNNGFLLKCRNYSWNYFILKKIFLKQSSMLDFVKIICQLSADSYVKTENIKKYRLALYAHTNWNLDFKVVWDSLSPIESDSNEFYITVTNKDPLNSFVDKLSSNCTEDNITPDLCLHYWNELVKATGNKSIIGMKGIMFTGSNHFGKNWLVSSAFVSDNQIMCWMEEINLQMGKKVKLVLTKKNVTIINTKYGNK